MIASVSTPTSLILMKTRKSASYSRLQPSLSCWLSQTKRENVSISPHVNMLQSPPPSSLILLIKIKLASFSPQQPSRWPTIHLVDYQQNPVRQNQMSLKLPSASHDNLLQLPRHHHSSWPKIPKHQLPQIHINHLVVAYITINLYLQITSDRVYKTKDRYTLYQGLTKPIRWSCES